jgi:REP element-mobilizing transposase RayT
LRGNHRQDIFRRAAERTLLNKIVARALAVHGAEVHAFCWMTNHLHFLVRVGDKPLGHVMRQVASEYARAFQLSLHTTGHLFENRYHATMIDTDAYLLEALRYVHQNPLRARLVTDVGDYRWSSHAAYLGGGHTPWVSTDFLLAMFSDDRSRARAIYRAFVKELPPAAIAEELASLEAGVPFIGKAREAAPSKGAASQIRSLTQILSDACGHFAVTLEELRSPVRTERLVVARTWVAHEATRHNGLALSAVARELGRDQSTLRSGMRKYTQLLQDLGKLSPLSPPGTTIPAAGRGSRFP